MVKNHKNTLLIITFFFSDLVLIQSNLYFSCFFHSYLKTKQFSFVIFENYNYYQNLFWMINGIWIIVFFQSKMYIFKKGYTISFEIYKIFSSSILLFSLLFILMFVVKSSTNEISRFVFTSLFISNVLTLTVFRFLIKFFLLKKKGKKIAIIICENKEAKSIYNTLHKELWIDTNIVGFISTNKKSDKKGKIKKLGSIDNIFSILEKVKVKYSDNINIFFEYNLIKNKKIINTIKNIYKDTTYPIKIIPDMKVFNFLVNFSLENINNLMLFSVRENSIHGFNLILKRFFDIVFSLFALTIFSPFGLLIAFLIKITSEGPIFYTQERITENYKKFKMFKFRTMPVNAEKKTGPKWSKKNENRATNIGSFLRKSSLDEFPQFINVLKGEMSVVGPRPEREFFVNQFKKKMDNYMSRHSIKTGITGWAQINGLRGNTSIEERLKHDIYYINNWSLLLDLKIIFFTLFKGFFHKNAY